MIRILKEWVNNAYVRINTGLDMLPQSTSTVSEVETYLAPFNLYVVSSDDDYCYVAVKPALVNEIVPSISVDDEDVLINSEEVPTLEVDIEGRVEVYLNIVIERDNIFDSFSFGSCTISLEKGSAVGDTDFKITNSIILGYVDNGVATSYHSTSLHAEICEESVTVWAV